MEQFKLSPSSKKISVKSFKGKSQEGMFVNGKQLTSIKSKVITIEKLLGKENSMLKKQLETQRKQTQTQKRKATEDKFEKKPNPKKEEKRALSMPRIGFLEGVKNFIGKVFLGFLVVKLLPYLPQLLKILPLIQNVVEWVTDFGIGLIDVLGSFLEGAYQLRDKTIGFIKTVGGDGAVSAFLGFEKAIETVLTALIAVGGIMAIAAKGSGGRGGRNRIGFDANGRRVGKSAQKRYFQKYGRDAFIERFGKGNLKNLPKKMQRSAATKIARRATTAIAGKTGAKVGLKFLKRFISPLVKRIPLIGGLIDFALNYFVFKEPLGRAAFAAIGSTIFGALGATLGTIGGAGALSWLLGPAGAFLGGIAGDFAGKWLYDTFFSNQKPLKGETGSAGDNIEGTRSSTGQSSPKADGSMNMSQVQGAALGMSEKQAFATVYELAKKHKAKFPEVVAAQAMHETGFLSESLTSVFNSSGRTNAFGQTGDRGYGTMPRAGSSVGWTRYPSLDIAVKDNIKMWHRVTNHPGNYEAFATAIEGIASVAPVYSPNADPANIKLGYTVDAYSSGMVKIMKSMGFDPYTSNALKDLSSDAQLQGVTPIMSSTSGSRPDLSDTQQGAGTEAGKKLLKDFPQIKARGHDGQIFASGLGHYLKKVGAGRGKGIGDYGDPQPGQTNQMEHPDHGGIVASHNGDGHSLGIALDLGANSATSGSFQQDQKNLWPHIARYLKKYGLNQEPYVPQVIHGPGESFSPVSGSSFPDGGHHNHFHVEFQRAHSGKRTGGINGNEFLTNVLKTERILDADTSRALGDTLLARLDDASTSAGVRSVLAQALGISQRANYEESGTGTVIVNQTMVQRPSENYGGGAEIIPIPIGGGNDNDYTASLIAGQ